MRPDAGHPEVRRSTCMNGWWTATGGLCIMRYALFLSAPLYHYCSAPNPMHFEIYAIRYYAIRTF